MASKRILNSSDEETDSQKKKLEHKLILVTINTQKLISMITKYKSFY